MTPRLERLRRAELARDEALEHLALSVELFLISGNARDHQRIERDHIALKAARAELHAALEAIATADAPKEAA